MHYTSHLVHLDCLTDGAGQREDFADFARKNCAGVNVIPYGRMDTAATYADVVRYHEHAFRTFLALPLGCALLFVPTPGALPMCLLPATECRCVLLCC